MKSPEILDMSKVKSDDLKHYLHTWIGDRVKNVLKSEDELLPSVVYDYPHDPRCRCHDCVQGRQSDCVRHSRWRINAYRALASPMFIALSARDPILVAFQLSCRLQRLSMLEPEYMTEYLALRRQCQAFATALLNHTHTSYELLVLLDEPTPNSDPKNVSTTALTLPRTDEQYRGSFEGLNYEDHNGRHLARLKLAIKCKQKTFCAHADVQQLLATMWYEQVPGFRSASCATQTWQIMCLCLMFPIYSIAHLVCPNRDFGRRIEKPFVKFVCHSASYVTFLFALILSTHYRPAGVPVHVPTCVELALTFWIAGLIWAEWQQIRACGCDYYFSDAWNTLDLVANSCYVGTIVLRLVSYFMHSSLSLDSAAFHINSMFNINNNNNTNAAVAHATTIHVAVPREQWDAYDPILLSEALFAAATILSALKLVYIFLINPHLGSLQISLARMMIDILKFAWIYALVLFSFACGMNQLLWYYADLERHACLQELANNVSQLAPINLTLAPAAPIVAPIIIEPSTTDREQQTECDQRWRHFSNVFEASQTLFWATFGLVDLANFELRGIQQYTRFWALLMFGCYCFINVVLVLNLLIAMMNHSYEKISAKADVEWKFARTRLWLSYFDARITVPPPFNIIPSVGTMRHCMRRIRKLRTKAIHTTPEEPTPASPMVTDTMGSTTVRYSRVMHALVRRYIKENPID
ncbi:Transient receptor potential-gamma protein, partial [Fragariocoptes setiger]